MATAELSAVIFDLDGVITDTAEFHYQGWQRLADEHGIPFDREMNEALRGLSRRESLLRMLGGQEVSEDDLTAMMAQKNRYYVDFLDDMTPRDVLPGAIALVVEAKRRGLAVAIGSSSRNARQVLRQLGLTDLFDAIADGNSVEQAKPEPDLFLVAADLLGLAPERCVVVEDANSGVDAALAAGMVAVGVGPVDRVGHAQHRFATVADVDLSQVVAPREIRLDDGPVLRDGWIVVAARPDRPAPSSWIQWEVAAPAGNVAAVGHQRAEDSREAEGTWETDLRYGQARRTVRPDEGPILSVVDEDFSSLAQPGLVAQRGSVRAAPGTVLEAVASGVEHAAVRGGRVLREQRADDRGRPTRRFEVEVGETGVVSCEAVAVDAADGGDGAVSAEVLDAAERDGYEVLLARHATVCDRWWRRVDVRIDGDVVAQTAVRHDLHGQVVAAVHAGEEVLPVWAELATEEPVAGVQAGVRAGEDVATSWAEARQWITWRSVVLGAAGVRVEPGGDVRLAPQAVWPRIAFDVPIPAGWLHVDTAPARVSVTAPADNDGAVAVTLYDHRVELGPGESFEARATDGVGAAGSMDESGERPR